MAKQPATVYDIPITTGLLIPTEQNQPLPVLQHTDMQATIVGPLSMVQVTQQFEHTHTRPIEALYVFPLPEDAAVSNLSIRIGDRTIDGTVEEREAAKAAYQQARDYGNHAALLEQERPNVFVISIANIQPHETIVVLLTFYHQIPYEEKTFTLALPTVVLPRYTPAHAEVPTPTTTEFPNPPLIPDDMRDGHTLSVRVELDVGHVTHITSPSHDIDTVESHGKHIITLRDADAIPNKDVIVRYGVASDQFETAFFTDKPENGVGTWLLMLTPQVTIQSSDVIPREVLFVLDRSGSMGNSNMTAACNALRSCLRSLNPGDTFNIFPFDHEIEQFSSHSLPFLQEYIEEADEYIDEIESRGGTEILQALQRAFNQPRHSNRLRVVVFLTDGAVSNEDAVLQELRHSLNETRVYAFGVGTAVNRFLLDKLAEVGRGSVEYIFPGDDIEDAISRFQNRAAFPLLTNITLEWGDAHVTDIYPTPLPDVFDGQPLVVCGRFHRACDTTLTLRGNTRNGAYEQHLAISLPAATPDRNPQWAVLATMWARARIDALMNHERNNPTARSTVRDEILGLALEHNIVTPYTSFVAIEKNTSDNTPYTPHQRPDRVMVPIHLPQGTRREAFEQKQQTRRSHAMDIMGDTLSNIGGFALPVQTYAPMSFSIDDAIGVMDKEQSKTARSLSSKPTNAEPNIAALRYLARTQRVNGAWGDESVALVSLIVLAFLRCGHTDGKGDFRSQLQRALRWLATQQATPHSVWALAACADYTGNATHIAARDAAFASITTQPQDAHDVACIAMAQWHITTAAHDLPLLSSLPSLPPCSNNDESITIATVTTLAIRVYHPDSNKNNNDDVQAWRQTLTHQQVSHGSQAGAVQGTTPSKDNVLLATAALSLLTA